jgi:hypothetical protein
MKSGSRRRLSAACRFSKETFAAVRRNEEHAPLAVLSALVTVLFLVSALTPRVSG